MYNLRRKRLFRPPQSSYTDILELPIRPNAMMEYDFSFRKEIDMHNKCCGGMLWCIRDICGIICAILTWLLILYAEFVVMSVILIPSPYPIYSIINIILFQTCAFLAFASHLRTMFTDPVSQLFCRFIRCLFAMFFRVQFRRATPRRT